MKNYKIDQIRNIALLGHGSSGKTTLTESALFITNVVKRMGKVEDGNTVSDYDKEEIARKFSIGTSVIPIEWNNYKYNFLDTPGYFDFVGEALSALRVADGAVILVDASSGVEVGTEKAWKYTSDAGVPRIIFVNKMDKENVNFNKIIEDLKENFGNKVIPIAIPIGEGHAFKGFVNVIDLVAKEFSGKDFKEVPIPEELEDEVQSVREALMEAVAESDEELLEKYFEGEEFTQDEIQRGLKKGIISGDIVPVLLGSATNCIGVEALFETIGKYMPSPKEVNEGVWEGVNPNTGEKASRKASDQEPFSAFVFKTIVDPFVGKISIFKVCSGKITKDMEVYNANKEETEKIGNIFLLRGKNQIEASEICAGDIGATAKLQSTATGETLCLKNNPIKYEGIDFPEPCLFLCATPKAKGDEEKMSSSLQRLTEEDPTFVVQRNTETKQL